MRIDADYGRRSESEILRRANGEDEGEIIPSDEKARSIIIQAEFAVNGAEMRSIPHECIDYFQ
jgi:hypothetical protein